MGAFMGVAGLQGMLRRTLCYDDEFLPCLVLAALSGALLLIALMVFLYNIVMTLGLQGAVGLFKRSSTPASVLVPGMDVSIQSEPEPAGA